MADGFKSKRFPVPARPNDVAPLASASLEERQDWAERMVWWFLSVTGGDPEIEGVPAGHRWRMEYFECVRDPRAFEAYADAYVENYRAEEG